MAIPYVYSLRGILVRKANTAMAVGGIALVVFVFVLLFAMREGLRRSVASSGSPENLIVLRKGAEAELNSQVLNEHARLIQEAPFVAQSPSGGPLCVFETVTILTRPRPDGGTANLSLRGTKPNGRGLHKDVRLVAGRWFREGVAEVAVGEPLTRRAAGFGLGRRLDLHGQEWTITGVFSAAGSALESEIWMDEGFFQLLFNREGSFSSVLFRARGDPVSALAQARQTFDQEPRLRHLTILSEEQYYANQSKLMAEVIRVLAWVLTLIMAVGAIIGAMNTMYASVSQRQREIGCLLAMGFSPEAIWGAFILESLFLSLLGAALGCLLSLPLHGMRTGTTNWMTFAETAFTFQITPEILSWASLLAIAMGFVGGFFPAFRAARWKVVEALRRT
jgi:ABC-type antimicrobial peptide transport system permease subunit